MRLVFLPLLALSAGCFDVDPSGTIESNGGGSGGGGGGSEPPPQATVMFGLDILPILQQECVRCHGGAGGLSLENFQSLMVGGDSGPVVLPFDPDESLLVKRLEGTIPPQMPEDAPPLSQPEIDTIRLWIEEGARDN